MSGPLYAEFATDEEFLRAYDAEVTAGGLLVRGVSLPANASHSGCTLQVRIAGRDVAALSATIASATPGAGVTVIFLDPPAVLHALAERLRAPPEQPEPPATTLPDLDTLSCSTCRCSRTRGSRSRRCSGPRGSLRSRPTP